LSAAGRAADLGLSHVLLEKTDHLSDTIYKYQKGKHVMATPSSLVLRSDLDFDAGKRETILGIWDEQADSIKIDVRYDADVLAIDGEKGNFTLKLKGGDTLEAEAVILAIGTQAIPTRCAVTARTCPISSTSSTIRPNISTSTSLSSALATRASRTRSASRRIRRKAMS